MVKLQKEGLSLPEPIAAALSELQECIAQRFPTASFRIRRGIDDAEQVYLLAIVDVEDPDTVMDTVLSRLLELQLDQGLPINVVPVHTPERIAETRKRLAAHHSKHSVMTALPPLLPG